MRKFFAILAIFGIAVICSGCTSMNLDKHIVCRQGQAYYMNTYGPVALVDRVPDADSTCQVGK